MNNEYNFKIVGADGSREFRINFDDLPADVRNRVIWAGIRMAFLCGDARVVPENEEDKDADEAVEQLLSAVKEMERHANLVHAT